MARIIITRHAESIANTQGIYQGQTYDTQLSALGRRQALALAGRLTGNGVDKVITSPLLRTRQTAEFIASAAGCMLVTDERIMETNHGDWEGRRKGWIKRKFPKLWRDWQKRPYETAFPNGERFRDAAKRVNQFLLDTKWGGTVVVVTHDNVIRLMVAQILGLPINAMWNIPLDPAGITTIEVDGRKIPKLITINDVSHLDGLRGEVAKHAL